ncbi:MAG: hypothetical protein WBF00_15895, partial [Methylocella sp.]
AAPRDRLRFRECHLRRGVDEGLPADAADSFPGAGVEGVPGAAIAGARALELGPCASFPVLAFARATARAPVRIGPLASPWTLGPPGINARSQTLGENASVWTRPNASAISSPLLTDDVVPVRSVDKPLTEAVPSSTIGGSGCRYLPIVAS